jgi:predicted enzyme related to lactoylglutathione lyase
VVIEKNLRPLSFTPGKRRDRALLRRVQCRRSAHRFGSARPQQGHAGAGPVDYWHVNDIEASVKLLLDAGAQVQEAVSDVGGGKLVASVRDADGNVIGLIQTH